MINDAKESSELLGPEIKFDNMVNARPNSNGSGSKSDSLWTKYVKITGVVAAYWFVSITMVFLNKYLLSGADTKLDAPFFITWFQCVVTVLLCGVLSGIAAVMPHKISFPPFRIEYNVCMAVLPLSIVFVAMISFNNLCLKYVGVAFYYIGRSLTTVFNVILSYTILGESTSGRAVGCCAIIIAGFFLGVDQEGAAGTLSVSGVIYGVLASLSVALYAIYTKKVLPAVEDNIWKLALYNNFNASLLMVPLMLFNGDIVKVFFMPNLFDVEFWLFMFAAGVFGFAIGYVTGLQIQFTTPLTHNISGTAKAAAQTVMATAYYLEIKPTLWWASNGIVLLGSGLYTYVRSLDMKKSHAAKNGNRASSDAEVDEKLLPLPVGAAKV